MMYPFRDIRIERLILCDPTARTMHTVAMREGWDNERFLTELCVTLAMTKNELLAKLKKQLQEAAAAS